MPVFPGQMRYIRKNLFHAVYVFDPASACGAEASLSLTSLKFLFFVYFYYLLTSSLFLYLFKIYRPLTWSYLSIKIMSL